MTDTKGQELINNYKLTLADMQKINIETIQLGFIPNDCSTMVYPILIHCLENSKIFNETQLNNIQGYINKLNYVG